MAQSVATTSIRGPKRGRISTLLPRAAVPWAGCEYIKRVFDPDYKPALGKKVKDFEAFKGIENFAFNVVAHILGAAGTRLARRGHHFIHVEVFPALGSRTGKYRQQDIDSLVKAGIITPARRPSRKAGKATAYRLHTSIRSAMTVSDDDRLFDSWSDFDRMPPRAATAAPVTGIARSFQTVLGVHDPDLEAIMLAMQAEGMYFDRRSCRAFLRGPSTGLTGQQHAHHEAFAEGLHNGPNYPTFALTKSGRVQTVRKCCLQNVPRVLRRFWYAPPGFLFLDFDFRSQEPFILAKLSGDDTLMGDLARDLYADIAQRFSSPAQRFDRDMAKTVVNGAINGGGSFKLAQEAFESEWSKPSDAELQFIGPCWLT